MSKEHTLNRKQAAEHLGISLKTIFRYMRDHGLPSIKAPGRNNRLEYRFSIEELDKWDYIRKNVPAISQDKPNPQPSETIDKGQDKPGQRQDEKKERDSQEKESDSYETGQKDSLLELLLTSYKDQIISLQDQLARKDEQINALQESSANLLQLAQAQMPRIEHQSPKKKSKKKK